jgi:hypothetical protein
MNKILGLLIIFFLQVGCANSVDNTQCKSIHNGHFCYTVSTNGKEQKFDVYRNDSIQIEVASQTKDTSIYNITWQNDCNYSLILRSVNFNFSQQKIVEAQKFPLITKVITLADSYYEFKSIRPATRFVYNDTMLICK